MSSARALGVAEFEGCWEGVCLGVFRRERSLKVVLVRAQCKDIPRISPSLGCWVLDMHGHHATLRTSVTPFCFGYL